MENRKEIRKTISIVALTIVIIILILGGVSTDADTVQVTFWALVPPVIAIVLALITKEVYSSLFIGIVAGGLLYSGYNFEGTVNHVFADGIIAVLSDSYNVGILVFLVLLDSKERCSCVAC